MGTYWLTNHLGVAADYRIGAGTTPLFPNPYYNRVLVYQNIISGGVQWRGPKNRYFAIDYHALGGETHGVFDHAMQNYPRRQSGHGNRPGSVSQRQQPVCRSGRQHRLQLQGQHSHPLSTRPDHRGISAPKHASSWRFRVAWFTGSERGKGGGSRAQGPETKAAPGKGAAFL